MWARIEKAPRRWQTVIIVVIFALPVGLTPGMFQLIGGLISGLISGLIGGLIGGLFGGLRGSILDIKAIPNLGIKLSMRNAVPWGGLGLLVFGLSNGLISGLIAFFWYGGQDVIQHYILRFILYRNGHMPLRYAHFLDYAARPDLVQSASASSFKSAGAALLRLRRSNSPRQEFIELTARGAAKGAQ